jgi:hypothetical protein
VRATLPYYGRNIRFFILSIQYFPYSIGSAAGTYWLLRKASIMPKHPGNTSFELQINDVPHGQEDLVYLYGLLFKAQNLLNVR